MMTRSNLFLMLSLFVTVLSQTVKAEELFVAVDQATLAKVELFEFDSMQQQNSAINLAKSLRCPQCQNQNLVESNSPVAKALRLKVFEMIKQGQSEQQVIDYMTHRFGDFVLYQPPFKPNTLILWLLPILFILLSGGYIYRSVRKSQQE